MPEGRALHVEDEEDEGRIVSVFGALTQAREGHASAFVAGPDCPAGCVYLLGGGTSDSWSTRDVVRYDPASPHGDVTRRDVLLLPRADATAVALEGRIYLFGGFAVETYAYSVEVYDVASNTTEEIEPPEWVDLGRTGIAAVALGESIYLFGGCSWY
ncbi:MAG TPA: kelch repeat-containing protein, partial [Candidatus Thermoplasmatota archaeon]|nr:kelch repeat-containing protein [Candidatus Thermoplasmatota archaeon]